MYKNNLSIYNGDVGTEEDDDDALGLNDWDEEDEKEEEEILDDDDIDALKREYPEDLY